MASASADLPEHAQSETTKIEVDDDEMPNFAVTQGEMHSRKPNKLEKKLKDLEANHPKIQRFKEVYKYLNKLYAFAMDIDPRESKTLETYQEGCLQAYSKATDGKELQHLDDEYDRARLYNSVPESSVLLNGQDKDSYTLALLVKGMSEAAWVEATQILMDEGGEDLFEFALHIDSCTTSKLGALVERANTKAKEICALRGHFGCICDDFLLDLETAEGSLQESANDTAKASEGS